MNSAGKLKNEKHSMDAASPEMQSVIKLAMKWNNSQTEYNRIQFLSEFNKMNEADQDKAVETGSQLSRILIGWCAATRLEIQLLRA